MQRYFYLDPEDREVGPLDLATLAKYRAAGVVNSDTLIRAEDSTEWQRCREVIADTVATPQTTAVVAAGAGSQSTGTPVKWVVVALVALLVLALVLYNQHRQPKSDTHQEGDVHTILDRVNPDLADGASGSRDSNTGREQRGTPKDVLEMVHRLVIRQDFGRLADMTPPAFRTTFRETLDRQGPIMQHVASVADLMDVKLGHGTGDPLRMMALRRRMDPLGRAAGADGSIDWDMVELKEIDSTHIQVGVQNRYGHFVRSCFLIKQSGRWYWLPTSSHDLTPEQMKAEWTEAAALGIKFDAAISDFEEGLKRGTITTVNYHQKMNECLARCGLQ